MGNRTDARVTGRHDDASARTMGEAIRSATATSAGPGGTPSDEDVALRLPARGEVVPGLGLGGGEAPDWIVDGDAWPALRSAGILLGKPDEASAFVLYADGTALVRSIGDRTGITVVSGAWERLNRMHVWTLAEMSGDAWIGAPEAGRRARSAELAELMARRVRDLMAVLPGGMVAEARFSHPRTGEWEIDPAVKPHGCDPEIRRILQASIMCAGWGLEDGVSRTAKPGRAPRLEKSWAWRPTRTVVEAPRGGSTTLRHADRHGREATWARIASWMSESPSGPAVAKGLASFLAVHGCAVGRAEAA